MEFWIKLIVILIVGVGGFFFGAPGLFCAVLLLILIIIGLCLVCIAQGRRLF